MSKAFRSVVLTNFLLRKSGGADAGDEKISRAQMQLGKDCILAGSDILGNTIWVKNFADKNGQQELAGSVAKA